MIIGMLDFNLSHFKRGDCPCSAWYEMDFGRDITTRDANLSRNCVPVRTIFDDRICGNCAVRRVMS